MPKVPPEQLERRREEIIDACEKIYRQKGFLGVTIKEISQEITCTRPAIYHYFETKEEILLALLEREYSLWLEALANIQEQAGTLSKDQLAQALARSLENRQVLLRIQNMNLCEIEQNSRIERLTEFKVQYQRLLAAFGGILQAFFQGLSSRETESLCLTFFAFLFGVYPFVYHTEKQLESMARAGVTQTPVTIYDMVYQCLTRLLPEKK